MQVAPFVARGGNGTVYIQADRAMKFTNLFTRHGALASNNISEAVLSSTVARDMPRVLAAREAWILGSSVSLIALDMEPGGVDLHTYIQRTPWAVRATQVERLLVCLVEALHTMHSRELAHLDIKPGNVVAQVAPDGSIQSARLIDLGAARFLGRARNGEMERILGTLQWRAPESLLPDAVPTKACDAYSLGALLYSFVYDGQYIADFSGCTTDADFLTRYPVTLPITCRPGCPVHVHNIMLRLLDPNPALRLNITSFYLSYSHPNTIRCPPFILDCVSREQPLDARERRSDAIDIIIKYAHTPGSAPLAVSIFDRYSNWGDTTLTELQACAELAHAALFPDHPVRTPAPPVLASMERIANTLGFELYSDTCEWILRLQHGVERPDFDTVMLAIRWAGGDTMKAVRLYLLIVATKKSVQDAMQDAERAAFEAALSA